MLEEKFRVSIHRHYYRICLEQRKAYNELDTSLSSLKHAAVAAREIDLVSEKYQEDYEKREQAAVIAITFAGMCLEAFFYDYAATSLGDTFAADHLDKLDLCSKLLVVPRLVCGTGIEKSSPVYEKVKRLTRDRNFLVHFKSRGFDYGEIHKASEFHDELNKKFREAVTNGIKAIELVMQKLDELHGRPDYYFNRVCR